MSEISLDEIGEMPNEHDHFRVKHGLASVRAIWGIAEGEGEFVEDVDLIAVILATAFLDNVPHGELVQHSFCKFPRDDTRAAKRSVAVAKRSFAARVAKFGWRGFTTHRKN